ncbi:hypothetical protein BJV78DRAFT_837502 [Lactifluus subvellereus]|nr:hypothetical protein BJV78DRAFT_837502 [Lactifluus subvellereus]
MSSTPSHDQHHPHPSHENHYHLSPSFPSAVLPPHMLHHRRSTSALAEHPYALSVCRPSPSHTDYPPPSGPPPGLSPPHPPAPHMRASISEGMDMPGLTTSRFASSGGVGVQGTQTHLSARFHPFQSHSRRPNLAHRASVPAIFHTTHTHPSAPAMPMSSFPPTPTSAISPEEQHHQRDMFLPRISTTQSHGPTPIHSALVLVQWRSRQTQGTRLDCRPLWRLQLAYRQAAMSFPSASTLRLPRTSTRNTPLPSTMAYTDARLAPSSPFMVRRATQARQPALRAVRVRTFRMSPVRARGLTRMAAVGRAYQRVSC